MKTRELWLRIDNLQCHAKECQNHKDGYSFLPSENETPEVYCGHCGGRVSAEFITDLE